MSWRNAMHRKQFNFSAFLTPADIPPATEQWWRTNGEHRLSEAVEVAGTRIEDDDFWKPFFEKVLGRNGKMPAGKRGRPAKLLPPGTKFGCFSLTGQTERRPRSGLYYEIRCDVCGRTKWIYVSNLRSLNKTCKCEKKPRTVNRTPRGRPRIGYLSQHPWFLPRQWLEILREREDLEIETDHEDGRTTIMTLGVQSKSLYQAGELVEAFERWDKPLFDRFLLLWSKATPNEKAQFLQATRNNTSVHPDHLFAPFFSDWKASTKEAFTQSVNEHERQRRNSTPARAGE
jgi:hypothetical protein